MTMTYQIRRFDGSPVATAPTLREAALTALGLDADDPIGINPDYPTLREALSSAHLTFVITREDGARPMDIADDARPWAGEFRESGKVHVNLGGRIFRGRVADVDTIHGQMIDRAPGAGYSRSYRYWVIAHWAAIDAREAERGCDGQFAA